MGRETTDRQMFYLIVITVQTNTHHSMLFNFPPIVLMVLSGATVACYVEKNYFLCVQHDVNITNDRQTDDFFTIVCNCMFMSVCTCMNVSLSICVIVFVCMYVSGYLGVYFCVRVFVHAFQIKIDDI